MVAVLRDGIVFCVSASRVIFLDLPRGRYFALAAGANDAFLRLVDAGGVLAPCPTALEPLYRTGVLIDAVTGTPPVAMEVDRASTQFNVAAVKPTVAMCASAILAQLKWTIRLKRRPLAHLVGRSTHDRRGLGSLADQPAASKESLALALSLAAAFRSTRNLRPRAAHCLTSSLAYLDLLRRSGMGARLIFAVRPAPFAAHCWVQCGETILNDDLEYTSSFTPIYAI
jgi:hypothetical protein